MVVFDFDMMDGTWQELGKQSFMSVWDDMFDYLAGGFKVWSCDCIMAWSNNLFF